MTFHCLKQGVVAETYQKRNSDELGQTDAGALPTER